MEPQRLGRRDGAQMAGGLGPPGHRERRLHPHDRAPPRAGGASACSRPSTATGGTTSTSACTRGCTASRARLTTRRTSSWTACARSTGAPWRPGLAGELLLPPVGLPRPPARALRAGAPLAGRAGPGGTRSSASSRGAARLLDHRTNSRWGIPLPGTRSTSATCGSTRSRTTSPPPGTGATRSGSARSGPRTST